MKRTRTRCLYFYRPRPSFCWPSTKKRKRTVKWTDSRCSQIFF